MVTNVNYIHAYIGLYLAVRSGNWELRNSSLKLLAEMFFAYSRDKYEVLVVNSLADSITYPKEIIDHFLNGEWTVSVKGKPFHNQAMDEAHETIINRKLKQITTRPSHFRMVNLADFMAYLDSVCTGLYAFIPKRRKQKDSDHQGLLTRAKSIVEKACIFSQKTDQLQLQNIFVNNPPTLLAENIKDLLQIAEVGKSRMFSYIRQYVLVPPKEICQKRIRQKLKTFASKKQTNTRLKTQLQQATALLSSAYRSIVAGGKGQTTVQTHPLPLAICKTDGTMRTGCKSDFKDVLMELFPDTSVFQTTYNCPNNDFEIIVDFLFYLHQPPPPDILTYNSFADYMWKKVVLNLGVQRGAKFLRIIVDKPQYLPKPRQLLHASRSSKSGVSDGNECEITSEGEIPHGKEFQQLLANKELKSKLVTYLMNSFRQMAMQIDLSIALIFDYADIQQPVVILNRRELPLPMLSNKNGEADYNVWFHVRNSLTQTILITGSDTDIWVYGMALFETGLLGEKQIVVERVINAEYVDINAIMEACRLHPVLCKIPLPANTLAMIYMLTGGDYFSHFYKTSKLAFVRSFVNNFTHIVNDGGLINMSAEGCTICSINFDAWVNLVCTVYLLKHKTLFNSEPIASLRASLQAPQLSPQKQNLLKWLAYSGHERIDTVPHWHEFVRRVCFYHSSGSKDHEYLLIPTMSSLRYHMLRCEYIMKLVYVSVQGQTLEGGFEQYGWKLVNGSVQIVWEDDELLNKHTLGKGCGCKGGV